VHGKWPHRSPFGSVCHIGAVVFVGSVVLPGRVITVVECDRCDGNHRPRLHSIQRLSLPVTAKWHTR
jgi:hypothetical protein